MTSSAKSKKQPRDKWLHVKVSLDEREHLKRLAQAQDSTVADLVRAAVSHRISGMKPRGQQRLTKAADPALLASLARIGNNLNQIARWCNRYQSGADAVQVLVSLASIEDEMKRLLPDGQPEEEVEDAVSDV